MQTETLKGLIAKEMGPLVRVTGLIGMILKGMRTDESREAIALRHNLAEAGIVLAEMVRDCELEEEFNSIVEKLNGENDMERQMKGE